MKRYIVLMLILNSLSLYASQIHVCAPWNKIRGPIKICAQLSNINQNETQILDPQYMITTDDEGGAMPVPYFISVDSRSVFTKKRTGEKICKKFELGKYVPHSIIERIEFNDNHLNMLPDYMIKELRCIKEENSM